MATQNMSDDQRPEQVEDLPDQTAAGGSRSRRKWFYRCLSLAFVPCLLGLLNVACYVCGFGFDTSLVIPSPRMERANEFVFNRNVDAAYWNSVDLNGPEARPFVLPKPSDTIRIVVVGASTIEGFPWAGSLTIPRQIEFILNRQLNSDRVEVLNCGVVGITSYGVSDLVRQSVDCEPDAIVVYTGHNDFYGPGGVCSKAAAQIPGTYPFMVGLRRYRLPQLLFRALTPSPDGKQTLTRLLADEQAIPYDGVAFRSAVSAYRNNLNAMVAVADDCGLPIVLCTPVCNLRHQSPVQSISDVALNVDSVERRDQLLSECRRCIGENEHDQGLLAAREAESIDGGFALAAYRVGQCLQGLGRAADAHDSFSLARDLDGCRFRAPSVFADVVREVAEDSDAVVADIEAVVRLRAQGGAPGEESFVEHVHLQREAMWDISIVLARKLLSQTTSAKWADGVLPPFSDADEQLGATAYDSLEGLLTVTRLLEQPPLSSAADVDVALKQLDGQIHVIQKTLSTADRKQFRILKRSGETRHLLRQFAEFAMRGGRSEEAIQLCEMNLKRVPWQADGYILFSQCLVAAGRYDKALQVVEQGLMHASDDGEQRLKEQRLLIAAAQREGSQ